jgi:hypothetical protein
MALGAGAALSGCASVDDALFGNPGPAEPAATAEATAPEAGTAPAPASENAAAPTSEATSAPTGEGAAAPPAEAAPAPGEMAGTLPSAAPAPPPAGAPAPGAATASVNAVVIAPGADTGTTVNHTIAGIRSELQGIENAMTGNGQQLATLRTSSSQQLASYHQTEAAISAHLQIGTTRGNPELVAQWNTAQSALDQLTSNINALNSLASQVSGEASRTRALLGQIQATFDVPGAVDEDHRQLTALEDEANQTLVLLDRLARDTAADLRRETVSLTNERASLGQLATAIKNGDLYGGASRGRAVTASAAVTTTAGTGGAPLVTIRFNRANVAYQKTLYEALTQALQSQPSASFNVVGVSPPRSSAQAVQVAQTAARRHAQDVMRTMTDMGVPAARMDISSSTDPSATASEVRVFVR